MEHCETINTRVHVGDDGVVNLQLKTKLPPGEYMATVELCDTVSEEARQEEWRRFVMETHGSITDPTFFRHEQGELETRDEFP